MNELPSSTVSKITTVVAPLGMIFTIYVFLIVPAEVPVLYYIVKVAAVIVFLLFLAAFLVRKRPLPRAFRYNPKRYKGEWSFTWHTYSPKDKKWRMQITGMKNIDQCREWYKEMEEYIVGEGWSVYSAYASGPEDGQEWQEWLKEPPKQQYAYL